MLSVLIAPAHYHLNDIYGSEETWPLNLMEFVTNKHAVHFEAISNKLSVQKGIPDVVFTTIERTSGKIGLFERLIFIFDVFFKAKKILARKDIQIIHHMLPCGVFKTFNLLFLFKDKKYKYVIGPLMLPPIAGDCKEAYLQLNRDPAPPTKTALFLLSLSMVALKVTRPILKYLHLKTIQKADGILFLDQKTKDFYTALLPAIEEKELELVTFGVNIENYKYTKRTHKGNLEILVVNRLDIQKGTHDVISAFANVLKKHKSVILRIVGDGPEADNLKKQADSLGISERVIFEGWVQNTKVPEYYQRADIYCNMSDEIYYGLVTVEAMASGLPVVRTNNYNVATVIEDRQSGFLVPVGDVVKLEKVLSQLIENEALRLNAGEKARRVMEERFDWKIIAQKQVDIYKRLLNE